MHSGTLNPLDSDIREGSPGHDNEDPYDGTIFPTASSDEHQEEHEMFREMKLRLWKARGVKEWVVRSILRYIVSLMIAVTLSIALFAAAYERLLG